MRDYYEVLGVSREATTEEIKKAYRKKARETHPDYAGADSEEAFKEVSLAYEVLSDPEKRRQYDMGGMNPNGTSGFSGGFNGSFADFGFQDIFEQMFGMAGFSTPAQGGGARSRRGQDVRVGIDLSLSEVVFGATKEVRLNTQVTCDTCGGNGCEPGTQPITCGNCQGTGQVARTQNSLFGAIRTSVPCGPCGGTGQTIANPCQECKGEGRTRSSKTVTVDIQAGVETGMRIRLVGKGEAGINGGPAGDLYVEVRELSDPVFLRRGDDLHTTVNVPMTAAALGTKLTLTTLDGDRELNINPGTQPDTDITLKGLGVGRLNRMGRGNLHVHVNVQVPTNLDERSRALLEEFAQVRGEQRVPVESKSNNPLKRLKEKLAGP